jgi:hypothetical protein
MILAPSGLLREPDQVRPSNVVVVPDLAASHSAKKLSAELVLISYSPPWL